MELLRRLAGQYLKAKKFERMKQQTHKTLKAYKNCKLPIETCIKWVNRLKADPAPTADGRACERVYFTVCSGCGEAEGWVNRLFTNFTNSDSGLPL